MVNSWQELDKAVGLQREEIGFMATQLATLRRTADEMDVFLKQLFRLPIEGPDVLKGVLARYDQLWRSCS